MTLYRLADNLAIRVGRTGVWIWAPDVSPHPIHLDERALTEMGLQLCVQGESGAVLLRTQASFPPVDPSRSA